MTIDGYAHCGRSKYLPVEDVLTVMQSASVDRAVLCQHLGEYDNQYLADVVERYPTTFAAVCLVDPTSPEASADLHKWHATGRFRGVRLLAEWLLDYEALWAQAVDLDMILVVYSPHGVAPLAPAVARFCASRAAARIVVTHLGNPRVKGEGFSGVELLRLAAVAGVFVQLSGLSQFCEYPHAALNDFIRDVIGEFGASRIYWGSNFPVCGDGSAYRRDLRQVAGGSWDLTPDQIRWITSRTAERLWFDARIALSELFPGADR
jgi:predicted TIM-barrel fold metal-dependent hydrolase